MSIQEWDVYVQGAVEEKPDPATVSQNTRSLKDTLNGLFAQRKTSAKVVAHNESKGTVRIRFNYAKDPYVPYNLQDVEQVEQVKFVRALFLSGV